jgi:phosphatidylglycerophosphate synthase
MSTENRRPVKSRNVGAFHSLASALVRLGLTPNQISVMSAVFAALGACCLAYARFADFPARYVLLVGALLGVQLRLTCNLIDGLMAVEGGKKTSAGEFFNDFPDRVSDILLLLGAGCTAASYPIAYAATILAILTAYIRVLGASMGAPALFLGPMAKQHRMAVLNLGIIGAAFDLRALEIALYVIAVGALVTCVRRALAIFRHFSSVKV